MSPKQILAAAVVTTLASIAGATFGQTTITIDRNNALRTSNLRMGVTHTSLAVDSNNVNASAAARAKVLLSDATKLQNISLFGWGTGLPQNAPTDAYDWSSLDARQAAIRPIGGDMVLTLCSAPGYMKGTPGTNYDLGAGVLPQYYSAYADMCVDALKHAKAIGKPFQYVQVWNEFKGFYDSTLTQYGGWDAPEYTKFYNTVYDKIKGTAGLENVKVGGFYLNTSGSGSNAKYGYTGAGTGQPLASTDKATLNYWLSNMHGADFMSVDHGVINYHDPNTYTPDQRIQLADNYATLMSSINSTLAAKGKSSLPVWMSEYYGLERDGPGTDAQEASLNAIIYKSLAEGGASTALMWNGGEGESHHAIYTDIRNSTGGYKTLHYDVFKAVNDYFGDGTPLMKVNTANASIVDGMASSKLAMLINKTGNAVTTVVNGRSVALDPYQVKVSTLLPTAKISFSSNSDFDSNFNTSTVNNGFVRDAATGSLKVTSAAPGMAAFDMYATGGANGLGGTGGLGANSDLNDFSISARVRTTTLGNTSQAGFLLRLDANESNGYLALASWDDTNGVRFRLFEGASIDAVGTQIASIAASTTSSLDDIAADTDYYFRVVAGGNVFTMQWYSTDGTLMSTTSVTDATLTASEGQAGVRLRAAGAATYMDDLQINLANIVALPEPTSITVFAASAVGVCVRRRRR